MLKNLLFCLVFALAACHKDDDKPSNNNLQLGGDWIISHFMEDGVDETSDFSGYTFRFSNNVITATKNGSTTSGTYATGTDDSKSKLIIDLGSADPLEELNEDWVILSSTSTTLQLQHVSGGDGSTDMLTFTHP